MNTPNLTPQTPSPATGPGKGMGQSEFIALIATLFATIALSIDAMLPALPEIAATMTPLNPNRAQLVIGTFFLGMGIGTIFAGPLSDAFGRRRVIVWGGAVYCIAAVVCYFAESFELFLAARVLQGIGAAGPRTVSLAMVRDLYRGREMARIMSFAMMVFMLVPAVAPLLGQVIIDQAGWHAIFVVYVLFCGAALLWMLLRRPETLPLSQRVPLSFRTLAASGKDLFTRKPILVSILIQSLTMAVLVASISSVQQVFEQHFDAAETFPIWFAVIAGLSAIGSFLNSRLVMRVGMRRVVSVTYAVVLVITLAYLAAQTLGVMPEVARFPSFLLWIVSLFAMMSLTMGNLNALAMEPLGHIAGFAASMIAAVATVISVLLAIPVALAFDGTPLPLTIGATIFIGASLALMRLLRH